MHDLTQFNAGTLLWDEVDTGALIYGPPGTGKTLFVQALARTCGLPIVAASAARWQAAGYLNDLLKAMQESFLQAQSKAPALLFIDELDAIGSRSVNDSNHSDYKRQVINGLLELLDGFERRTGIVVIGATNNPENVDTALLRSGRLGRHLEIPLPDATARRQILQFKAGFPVPDEHSDAFARATTGMSGADLEQLVRDGRRSARLQGKPFNFGHIIEVAPRLVDLPAKQMRVVAFHEAGHAIVGVELGLDLQGVSINDQVIANERDTLGGVVFATPCFPMKTRSYLRDHISMYLAGIAAETLVFGEFTVGATGHPSSDLALATNLATKIEACYGMGATLAIDLAKENDLAPLRVADLSLRKAVKDLLDTEFQRAKTILRCRSDALNAIAEILLATQVMNAVEIRDVLEKYPARREA
uniref:AAA family ATPase n=1 Tax=Agrobacterium albertimagni TaxID=147266 RepID=A0A7C1NZI3_9HYPH